MLRPKGDRTAGDAPKPANNTSPTGVATSVPTAPVSVKNCVLAMRSWHACHTPARSPRGGSCGESAPHVQTCDVDKMRPNQKKNGNPSGMRSRERQMGCESSIKRNQRGIISGSGSGKGASTEARLRAIDSSSHLLIHDINILTSPPSMHSWPPVPQVPRQLLWVL